MALSRPTAGRSVMLCGYYGEHNLGDDALLSVLLGELPDGWSPCITAFDQSQVMRLSPSAVVVQRRSLVATAQALSGMDALVLGGGSLLQDSTSLKSLIYYICLILWARCRGIPVILWGQGLGPLRRPLSRLMVRWVLPGVHAISWRDSGSMGLAERWKLRVPMLMAADPVWSYPGIDWIGEQCAFDERAGLVLCWRPTDQLSVEAWSDLLNVVEAIAECNQLPVTWLAFHQDQDGVLPQSLSRQGCIPPGLAQRSRFEKAETLDQVLDIMARAQLVLPMRLHALILAQLAGAPCAALSYDPKVAVAAAMVNVDCVDLDQLPTSVELEQRWQAQLMQPPNQATLAAIKREAAKHGSFLRQTLRSLHETHAH